MIGGLLRALSALLLYFCLATVITQTILLMSFLSSGKINREKLIRMLAVAHGLDQESGEEGAQEREDINSEQVSSEQLRMARAKQFLLLERREQAMQDRRDQVDIDQQKLVDERTDFQRIRNTYEQKKQGEVDGAAALGRAELVATLTTITPAQAKTFISTMLKDDQEDEVVALIKAMPSRTSGKIISEFIPMEIQEIYPVLIKIGRGFPEVNEALSAIEELKTNGKGP